MKKIPLIHGKFRAKNNPMKFHFAVFMGHEMIFMGFSHEIHGIFIKLQFIVVGASAVCSSIFGSPGKKFVNLVLSQLTFHVPNVITWFPVVFYCRKYGK